MSNVLRDFAFYVKETVENSKLTKHNYIGVDNLLPNCGGKKDSKFFSKNGTSTCYRKGDILVGNIRPYFKKIWYADCDGGCSNDVLCIRVKDNYFSEFIYSCLSQNAFFDYVMKGSKGSKMPRGDREHIMNFIINPVKNGELIGRLLLKLNAKIVLNDAINDNLEQQLKLLYDYWFVQFNFPDENGKPYRDNGGKMIWNEKLQQNIPEKWKSYNIREISNISWGQCPEGKNILPLTEERDNILDYCSGAGDMKEGFLVSCKAKTDDSKRLAYPNDILLSIAGKIGDIAVVDHKISIGRAAMAFSAMKTIETSFIYMLLKSLNKKLITISSGSIQKVINKDHIESINFAYQSNVILQFSTITMPIFNQLIKISQENRELIKFRNFILPLLMNGQAVIAD